MPPPNAAPSAASPAVVFLHLGKTAGSTLGTIIDRQIPHDQLHVIFTNDDNARFAALPEAYRARLRGLRGITYYGIHAHLPQGATYFTLLRHPFDRTISHYFHSQRRRARHADAPPKPASFDRYLDLHPEQATLQLRRIIGGADVYATMRDPLPPDAVEIAKRHIEADFRVVGLVERFDESLLLLQAAFGWGNILHGRRNVAPNRDHRASISPEAAARLTALIAPELALYEWAAARFEATIRAQPPQFADDLARFRARNRLYSRVWDASTGLRETAAWRALRGRISPTWRAPDDFDDD